MPEPTLQSMQVELSAISAALLALQQTLQQGEQQAGQQTSAQSARGTVQGASESGTVATETVSNDIGAAEATKASLADSTTGQLTNRKAILDDFRERVGVAQVRSSDHLEALRKIEVIGFQQEQLLLTRIVNNAVSHDMDVNGAIIGHHAHTPGAVVSESEPPNAAQPTDASSKK